MGEKKTVAIMYGNGFLILSQDLAINRSSNEQLVDLLLVEPSQALLPSRVSLGSVDLRFSSTSRIGTSPKSNESDNTLSK